MLTLRTQRSFLSWLSSAVADVVNEDGTVEVDPVGVVEVAAMCAQQGMPASFVSEAGVHDAAELFGRYVTLAVASNMGTSPVSGAVPTNIPGSYAIPSDP